MGIKIHRGAREVEWVRARPTQGRTPQKRVGVARDGSQETAAQRSPASQKDNGRLTFDGKSPPMS